MASHECTLSGFYLCYQYKIWRIKVSNLVPKVSLSQLFTVILGFRLEVDCRRLSGWIGRYYHPEISCYTINVILAFGFWIRICRMYCVYDHWQFIDAKQNTAYQKTDFT